MKLLSRMTQQMIVFQFLLLSLKIFAMRFKTNALYFSSGIVHCHHHCHNHPHHSHHHIHNHCHYHTHCQSHNYQLFTCCSFIHSFAHLHPHHSRLFIKLSSSASFINGDNHYHDQRDVFWMSDEWFPNLSSIKQSIKKITEGVQTCPRVIFTFKTQVE